MRNRLLPLSALAAAVLLALTACGGSGSSSSKSGTSEVDRDATLRVAIATMPLALDPHTGTAAQTYAYVAPVYDRLTQLTADLQLEPQLATKWESASDGMSWTFTLRQGVTFSDGEALDAAAVKASLDRAMEMPTSTARTTLSMIDSIEAVDPGTVRINTNRLAADLPFTLAGTEGSIISPAALDNPDLDIKPVGSGPYVLSKFSGGESVEYERRKGYWDKDAQQAAVLQVSAIADGSARLNALRSGQVDMIRYSSPEHPQVKELGEGFGHHVYPAAGPTSVWLNSGRPHISDERVRQALNWAIDRDAISDALMAGQCSPSVQPLPESYSGHLEKPSIAYGYDPDKARELLNDAGVPNGFSFRLLSYPHSPWGDMAAAIQDQLGKVGIEVQVEQLEPARAVPSFVAGGYDGLLSARVGAPTGAMVLADNYLTSRYPGPVPDGFEEAVSQAFDPRLSQEAQVNATEEASAIGNEFPLDLFICGDSSRFAATDRVVGADTMGVASMYGFADFRYVGVTK